MLATSLGVTIYRKPFHKYSGPLRLSYTIDDEIKRVGTFAKFTNGDRKVGM